MADVETRHAEKGGSESILVPVRSVGMSDGERGMVSNPSVVRERYPHDTQLRGYLQDIMTEKALLLVGWEVRIEVIKAEACWQLGEFDFGDVDGRGAERSWIRVWEPLRSVMIILRVGQSIRAMAGIRIGADPVAIVVHTCRSTSRAIAVKEGRMRSLLVEWRGWRGRMVWIHALRSGCGQAYGFRG